MTSTFQSVMAEVARAFECAERSGTSEKFWRIREDAPEWLQGSDFMLAVHRAVDGDDPRLPDDWIYEHTRLVALDLQDHDSPDDARDATHEIADGLVDIYTSARLAWLASHLRNADLCDEAAIELGASDDASMAERAGLGQYLALTRIAYAVIDLVESELDDRELAELDESEECAS